MNILISVIAFIIIFSLLIIVHEAGHFFAALWSGVKVREFGVGMPPKGKTLFKWRGVDFTLNWFPFGGFVRMKGQDDFANQEAIKESKDPDSFEAQSLPKRILIVVAGVVMNVIMAFVLFYIAFLVAFAPLGVVPDSAVDFDSYVVMRESFARSEGFLIANENAPEEGILISSLVEDSLGLEVGIQGGDVIKTIDGNPVNNISEFFQIITQKEDFEMNIERDGNIISYDFDRNSLDQKLGIYLEPNEILTYKSFGPIEALKNTFYETALQIRVTFFLFLEMIGGLVSTGQISEDVAGPVGIAQLTHNFTQQGIISLIIFTAVLSMSLAVINILPFPALDGGRLLFMIIEGITGRKVSEKIEGYIHSAGFILLMLLIVVVTWNDIMRFFN